LPSGSATNRSCPVLSATGTSSWPKQPTPNATRAGWPDASARATQASSPSSATQEAGPVRLPARRAETPRTSPRAARHRTQVFELAATRLTDREVSDQTGLGLYTVRGMLNNPLYAGRLPDGSDAHWPRSFRAECGIRSGSPRDSTHPRRSPGHASDLRAIDAPMLGVWSPTDRGHRPLPPHGAVRAFIAAYHAPAKRYAGSIAVRLVTATRRRV